MFHILPLLVLLHPSTEPPTVANTPSRAVAEDGRYISWKEHLIDGEGISEAPLRGGDGLAVADFDLDGRLDVVSVHEDSNHLRVAFGTDDPDIWKNVTLAEGADVGAIEDVAVGDLNNDGWPDIVAACEEAHLIYLQNPGEQARQTPWPRLIPSITQGRGSWLRVFIADLDQDGKADILAANKGAPDIIDPAAPASPARPTSLFRLTGDPLKQESWQEQVLSREVVPNTAMPVDIDADGDVDVLTAARIDQYMTILEVENVDTQHGVKITPHPITIKPGWEVPEGWQGTSSAFQSSFADLDTDGRPDLIVAVMESVGEGPALPYLGWLRQPEDLSEPWVYHRIGDTLPDAIIGISMADIDGDGDLDAIIGGYSGLNIVAGGYSGAAREEDSPFVDAAATVGRITWFEQPSDPTAPWIRHDISRRVRGMFDGFVPFDMDDDGDVDFVSTRGNSGAFDGVFWLEQVRSEMPTPSFVPARREESRHLPLPPEDWLENYLNDVTYVPANKQAKPE